MSKAANRNAMPGVAAIADEFRKVFPGLKVIYAAEGSTVIDRREPVDADSVFEIPSGYAPMREVQRGKK